MGPLWVPFGSHPTGGGGAGGHTGISCNLGTNEPHRDPWSPVLLGYISFDDYLMITDTYSKKGPLAPHL